MSAKDFEGFDHTIQLMHLWINELDSKLGWNNKQRSYRLLTTVLHALRDWLQLNEAVDLGAQLPQLLRGVYYEGWKPSKVPEKHRSKDDFLRRVDEAFKKDPLEHPARAVMAVFKLLDEKITAGEIEDVRKALPADLRNIWPEHYAAPGAVRR